MMTIGAGQMMSKENPTSFVSFFLAKKVIASHKLLKRQRVTNVCKNGLR
jgi:hypothetical protein